MDQQDQNTQDTNIVASRPSGTSENEGSGETPAGGTANPPEAMEHEFTASPELASVPTLADHIEAQAANIDAQIAAVAEKKAALGDPDAAKSPAARTVLALQGGAFDREIARLQVEKDAVLALLHEIPAEIHALEARFFAAVKHLF